DFRRAVPVCIQPRGDGGARFACRSLERQKAILERSCPARPGRDFTFVASANHPRRKILCLQLRPRALRSLLGQRVEMRGSVCRGGSKTRPYRFSPGIRETARVTRKSQERPERCVRLRGGGRG